MPTHRAAGLCYRTRRGVRNRPMLIDQPSILVDQPSILVDKRSFIVDCAPIIVDKG